MRHADPANLLSANAMKSGAMASGRFPGFANMLLLYREEQPRAVHVVFRRFGCRKKELAKFAHDCKLD
jgi:hypothetical protein